MGLITNIMVKFKEYKSYSFFNPEDINCPLQGVIEPNPDNNEINPEDIDGKWVYVFRHTSFTPEDGISVLVNTIHVRAGQEYQLALKERNSTFDCWSFFCLSQIELSPVRIEELRKKVHNLILRRSISESMALYSSLSCERLTLIPLDPHQRELISSSRLGQYMEDDVLYNASEGQLKATVFLHDHINTLEGFTKEYVEKRDSYLRFLNSRDSTFVPSSWNLSRNQSNLLSGLIRSLCKDEKYQRNIDYENWSTWDTETLNEHLKYQIPIKNAEVKILDWLKRDGLNATLFDYEKGQSDNEVDFPEDFILSVLEKVEDSVPISQFLSQILQDGYEKARECASSLGEDIALADATDLVGESNWWICYVGGFRNSYKNEIKPITSSTSKMLELLSGPLAKHARPTTVLDYIRDNRYKTSMVVFKDDSSFIMKGKACTSQSQFEKMVSKRYAGRYGDNIEVRREGNYWVAKYSKKVPNLKASQTVKGIAEALGDAMQVFDFACNVYDV